MKLTPQQIAQFREEGVLIAPNVTTDADRLPVVEDIKAHIDKNARRLAADGKITQLHEDKPFETRFTHLYRQTHEIDKDIDIMNMLSHGMFNFLHNSNLLDAVESIIGPEITCSPIQHLRAKIPANCNLARHATMSNVPWHQDAGVTWEEADASEIVTVWMPLINATRETGCMETIPHAYKRGYFKHIRDDYGTRIDPDAMPNDLEVLCCECPVGGAIFMNKMTPHRGIPNTTQDTVRWTIDLRFQKAGTPTGRPFHPDFIVRSRANPSSVFNDYDQWCKLWREALSKPQPQGHRVTEKV